MSVRTVVVTGVAGFIGSHLAARLLARGCRVVGIDDLSQGRAEQVPAGVELRVGDVRDPALSALFAGADTIFHLAAKNCIADCQTDPLETASVNVCGTVNVFEAARRAGVSRIIHAESSAVYEGVAMLPTPESQVRPRSVYAVSKMAAAAFAETYARFHAMRVTGLRYFCVYGTGQDIRRSTPPVMSAFIMHLLRGTRPVIHGDGEKRRDFVHVDDVNDFHLQCLDDARTCGQVFNLGSGESHSVRELLARIARLMNVDVEPVMADDRAEEAEATLADISAARALGWSPKVSLDDGLREMIAWLRSPGAVVRA